MSNELLKHIRQTASGHGQNQADMMDAFGDLERLVTRLEQLVVPQALTQTSTLHRELDDFSVRVSLIGQVKAGKTALSNAMIGQTNLLPSDVNPWTSVVTSVHLNAKGVAPKRALFQFFNREEWESMVETGGRVAEMARNASFDTDADVMREQIEEMQSRTEERLGANFSLLLGNQHAFSEFSSDLIKRYVCLGEEDNLSAREGRFADLTKSADLYMTHPEYKYPITISDTPGVNDPFLVREAVTLESLGQSNLCMIVLSAHQALSTVDLALMRILLALDHEQIVLFINRIDELPDPHEQMIEIESYVRATLDSQGMPKTIPIVFGSAAWADAALNGSMDDLSEDSLASLQSLVDSRLDANDEKFRTVDLSGLGQLKQVIDEKSANDVGLPFAVETANRAADIAQQSSILLKQSVKLPSGKDRKLEIADVVKKLEELSTHLASEFDRIGSDHMDKLLYDMSAIYSDFISKEEKALYRFLNGNQKLSEWAPEVDTLRKNLNTSYTTTTQSASNEIAELNVKTADLMKRLYVMTLGSEDSDFEIKAPAMGRPDMPVSLMRTMSVDMSSNWVAGWLTRKLRKDVYVDKFTSITKDEMRSTIYDVQTRHVSPFIQKSEKDLTGFVLAHAQTLRDLSNVGDERQQLELRRRLGVSDETEERIAALDDIITDLQKLSGSFIPQLAS